MSRTYRRKNAWYKEQYLCSCSYENGFQRIPLEGKARQKASAKFHGDVGYWDFPSKWYRKHNHRRLRRAVVNQIHLGVKMDDFDNRSIGRHILDNWYYW